MAIEVDSRNTVCVARQPILDLAGRVYGYELLYRSSSDAAACTADGDTAGARTLSHAVLALWLDVLTNGRLAFMNFTRSLIRNGAATLLPPTSMVTEVLDSVEVVEELIEACRSLHARGFALALDGFVPGSAAEEIIHYASFVKVDVVAIPASGREKLAAGLVP